MQDPQPPKLTPALKLNRLGVLTTKTAECAAISRTIQQKKCLLNFCRRRVVDVFRGASANPKDPHKSARHEHQRVGSRVSDAASLENAENAGNIVVCVLLRTFPF